MKLPPEESLVDPEHLFLYEHDRRELHNFAVGDFTRLMYVRRFQLVLSTVQRWAPGTRVLDVGCAQGTLSRALGERGYAVVALDLRPSFLRYLRLKYERGHVRCITATVQAFHFSSEHVRCRAARRGYRTRGLSGATQP